MFSPFGITGMTGVLGDTDVLGAGTIFSFAGSMPHMPGLLFFWI
jgi:hypothetical protein